MQKLMRFDVVGIWMGWVCLEVVLLGVCVGGLWFCVKVCLCVSRLGLLEWVL